MRLHLKRAQRDGGMLGNKVVFSITAQIAMTAEESALIKRYKLGKLLVYSSDAHLRHVASTQEAANRGTFSGLAKAALSAGMASLSLRCTIDSLVQGQHIECQDMPQLLAAEEAIDEACRIAKTFLDTAATFDGREIIMDY